MAKRTGGEKGLAAGPAPLSPPPPLGLPCDGRAGAREWEGFRDGRGGLPAVTARPKARLEWTR